MFPWLEVGTASVVSSLLVSDVDVAVDLVVAVVVAVVVQGAVVLLVVVVAVVARRMHCLFFLSLFGLR